MLWGSKKDNIWVIMFLLLLFQNALQRLTTGMAYQAITYLDEIAEILLLVMLIHVSIYKFSLDRQNKRIFITFLIWIIITIFSSIVNKSASVITIILDCFVCIKFMIFYQGGRVLSKRGKFTSIDLYKKLNSICKIITIMLLILSIHDLILNPFFEKFDYRYFTESLQLCFQHPTYLAAVCMACMVVLMCNMKYDQKNMKYIIMLAVIIGLTFRSKAIGSLLVVFAVYFSSVKYKMKTKEIILIMGICAALYFGMGQIETYFSVGTSVPIRLKMLRDGI